MENDLFIEINRIAPVVLRATMFTEGTSYPEGYRLGTRVVYDYELEYFLYSTGGMNINGVDYPVRKGDVVFRRPGEIVHGIRQYRCILICFDMLGNTGKNPLTYDFNLSQNREPNYRNPVIDAIPSIFHASNEGIRVLFENILKLYVSQEESTVLQMKGCILQLLYRCYQEAALPFHAGSSMLPVHRDAIHMVLGFIKDNLNKPLSLLHLARIANMSPSHFHKIFSAVLHETVNHYIQRLRLEKAREYLVQNNWPIHKVASACGYDNPAYFSYTFRKTLGITPSEYKVKHRYI